MDDWLRRWSGGRTFERFWLPLLQAKLGDSHREASAAFIWATIQRLYAAAAGSRRRSCSATSTAGTPAPSTPFAAHPAPRAPARRGHRLPGQVDRRDGDGFVLAADG